MTSSRARKDFSQRTLLAVVGGMVVIAGLLAATGMWFVFRWIANSAPSQVAQAFLREHPEVRADLGDPIEVDGFIQGEISDGAKKGSASLSVPLRGSQGSGHARVTLAKRGMSWRVTAVAYEGRDRETRQLALKEETVPPAEEPKQAAAVPAEEPKAVPSQLAAAQRQLEQAHELYKSGKSHEAIEVLNALLEQAPSHAEALYWRAQIRAKLGENELAREDIRRAVALRIDMREAYQLHDYLLMRERRWTQIIDAWTQYLERHPDDDVALLERAGAWHHQGNEISARKDLQRSCELGNAKACEIFNR
jgi:tetratricopeptide (TPR) repeat protein